MKNNFSILFFPKKVHWGKILPKTKSLLGTMNFPCTVKTRKLRFFSSLIPRVNPRFGCKISHKCEYVFLSYTLLGEGGRVGGEGMVKFQRNKVSKKVLDIFTWISVWGHFFFLIFTFWTNYRNMLPFNSKSFFNCL